MGKSLKVSPAKRTDNADILLTDQDLKQIARLGKLLKSDAASDLKTRHLVGKVLNERVGPPTERKKHGGRVLEQYGEKLGISPSDLNRAGWFAHLGPVLSTFLKQHPGIDSWTKFKTALPNLKPSKGGKARQPGKDSSRPAFGGLARSLQHCASKLDGLGNRPNTAERAEIVDALRVLAKAASSRLKIRVEVAAGANATSKPVATKRVNGVARA